MQKRIEHAIRQAMEAREMAETFMDTRVRDQWLQIAGKWDELASVFHEFHKARDEIVFAERNPSGASFHLAEDASLPE